MRVKDVARLGNKESGGGGGKEDTSLRNREGRSEIMRRTITLVFLQAIFQCYSNERFLQ